ncbi:nucleotide sugar dehydrogenase [Candidatus Nitrosotenuis cloacae]|uniref:nucleotide sugar dehydrogenase n=1 Tax=Candidatus Nitrosotenuis cloacae TaxID=1603555 RepID=UPI0022830DA3|nr:nucleotide sugar dehydrogenase [Candidatus Nitrosotenuis cloacae]
MSNTGEKTNQIMLQDSAKIQNLLKSGNVRVCVIGIGRIGLPTALFVANSKLPTIGVDINADLVNKINSKIFPLKDEPGYENIFNDVIDKKLFHATTKIEEAVPASDLILLSLPTPMDSDNIPSYDALKIVGKQLGKLITPHSLVVVESTIEPGFIENELIHIIESEGRLIAGRDFGIGVCPENANPGEILRDFTTLPRLVAGIDDKTANIILEIYHYIFPVELMHMPNCKTANAVKLTTNVFRDINIAFVNELAMLFERLDIDILKVLEAADKKYNFQVHYPGPGVGGPCLPVNSYQLLNSARKFDPNLLRIVKAGREINESMPIHVVNLLTHALAEANKTIEKSNILILGISYKPDVKDIQISPAESIVNRLRSAGATVKIYDPYFRSSNVYGIDVESELNGLVEQVDAVILVTAHKEFFDIEPTYLATKKKNLVVIDTRGIMDKHAARKAGLIFRGLGRGKSN